MRARTGAKLAGVQTGPRGGKIIGWSNGKAVYASSTALVHVPRKLPPPPPPPKKKGLGARIRQAHKLLMLSERNSNPHESALAYQRAYEILRGDK